MVIYRIEFSKDRRVAYVSHLEVVKVFSQALRRAGLPVAHTEGFNPRPRINFSSAVATGMTTRGECAEFELTRHLDPDAVRAALEQALPGGFAISRIRIPPAGGRSLMALLHGADYTCHAGGPAASGPLPRETQLPDLCRGFLSQTEIPFVSKTPKGTRRKDLRPGIVRLQVCTAGEGLAIRMRLLSGSQLHVRAEHVVAAFLDHAGVRGVPHTIFEKEKVYGLQGGVWTDLFWCGGN